MSLKIGELAARTGTTTPTIRYYEEIGLLSRARRDGRQRRYSDANVRRLTFIRRCRDFGFSIEQVRSLVLLMDDPNQSCMHARDVAQVQLEAIRSKMAELRALEKSVAAFVRDCDSSCVGGPSSECVILEQLTISRSA